MEAYQVLFPTLLRLKVTKEGKFVTANFSGRFADSLRMMVHVPGLSDLIYLHRMVIDSDTQLVRIDANAMKDHVGIVAWSHLVIGAPIISKIDFGRTLGRLFHPRWF